MAKTVCDMVTRLGGEVFSTPALQEIPLKKNPEEIDQRIQDLVTRRWKEYGF
jgi:hypothetical protein